MNVSELKKQLQENLAPVIKVARAFPWEDPLAYAMWSAQTFHFVKYSTRLFSLAAAKCPIGDNKTHIQFLNHLNEEKGHENLSTSDLKLLGFDLKDLPELPHTQSLYQNQYYYISEQNAYSFFGYLLTLEGLAVEVGPEVLKRARASHGLQSTKFLKVHSEEDVDHIAEVFQYLENVDSRYEASIAENLKTSCTNYLGLLDEVQTYSSERKRVKQAS